jgi:hypothetical protein
MLHRVTRRNLTFVLMMGAVNIFETGQFLRLHGAASEKTLIFTLNRSITHNGSPHTHMRTTDAIAEVNTYFNPLRPSGNYMNHLL